MKMSLFQFQKKSTYCCQSEEIPVLILEECERNFAANSAEPNIYADETNFWTKNDTGGRKVWRAVGSTPSTAGPLKKRPQKLMAWARISASSKRVLHFLSENETMTASRYASTLEKSGAGNLLKEISLVLYHDMACHTAPSCLQLLVERKGE